MIGMRFSFVRFGFRWFSDKKWIVRDAKLVAIVWLFLVNDDMRERGIAWRTITFRFPRWPWLHVEKGFD